MSNLRAISIRQPWAWLIVHAGKDVLSDCVNNSDSPWFFGPYGFVFTGVEPLEFSPCRGSLGFFNPENSR